MKSLIFAFVSLGALMFAQAKPVVNTALVESEITVDADTSYAGVTARNDGFVKKGAGTLAVADLDGYHNLGAYAGGYRSERLADGPDITVSGGSLAIIAAEPATADDLFAGAWIHLDASDETSFVYDTDDPTAIRTWKDLGDLQHDASANISNENYVAVKTLPKRVTDGGLAVVDFGGASYADPNGGAGAVVSSDSSSVSFPDGGVQQGCIVVRFKHGGDAGATYDQHAFFVGNSVYYTFHRGLEKQLLHFSHGKASDGVWKIDGRRFEPIDSIVDGEFHVISFMLAGRHDIDSIARDRNIRAGGIEVGEVVLFDPVNGAENGRADADCSDERMQAIEAALMAKWLNKTHPVIDAPVRINQLVFDDGVDAGVSAGKALVVKNIEGAGTFVKSGAGDVMVNGYVGFDGFEVAEGALTLSSAGNPLTILSQAFYHVDPSDRSTLKFDQNGGVIRIEDKNNSTIHAELSETSVASATLVEDWANGLPGIDLGDCYVNNGDGTPIPDTSCGFIWRDSAGQIAELVNGLRTAFIVVEKKGDHDPFLLGGVWNKGDVWEYALHADNGYYLAGNSQDSAKSGAWTLDGSEFNPQTTQWLADGVHVVSFRCNPDASWGLAPNIGMFGQDRGYDGSANVQVCRMGGLRYGEIIAFDRRLSDEDELTVRKYLLSKWKNIDSRAIPAVTVAAGATFAFAGNMTLADDAELTITYPLAETTPITVSGQLTLGKNVKVRVASDLRVPTGTLPLLSANEFSNAENLATWTAVGPGDRTYKLVRTDETLSVVVPGGFTVIVK